MCNMKENPLQIMPTENRACELNTYGVLNLGHLLSPGVAGGY